MGNVLKRNIARFETCAETVLPGNGKCTEAEHCAVWDVCEDCIARQWEMYWSGTLRGLRRVRRLYCQAMGNVLKRNIARFKTCAETVLPGNRKCTEAEHCAVWDVCGDCIAMQWEMYWSGTLRGLRRVRRLYCQAMGNVLKRATALAETCARLNSYGEIPPEPRVLLVDTQRGLSPRSGDAATRWSDCHLALTP